MNFSHTYKELRLPTTFKSSNSKPKLKTRFRRKPCVPSYDLFKCVFDNVPHIDDLLDEARSKSKLYLGKVNAVYE